MQKAPWPLREGCEGGGQAKVCVDEQWKAKGGIVED